MRILHFKARGLVHPDGEVYIMHVLKPNFCTYINWQAILSIYVDWVMHISEDYKFYYLIALIRLYGRILVHFLTNIYITEIATNQEGRLIILLRGHPGTWRGSVPRHAALVLLLLGCINNGQRCFVSRKRHFKRWKNKAYSRIKKVERRRKKAYRKEYDNKLTKDENE